MEKDYELIFDESKGTTQTRLKAVSPRKPIKGLFFLGLASEVGFTIAIPIAGGALIGVWADKTWGTYPKATLIGILIGIALSVVGFVRIIRDIIRQS